VQRTTTTLLGALLFVALGLLLWKGGPRTAPEPERPSWARAVGSTHAPMPSLSLDLPELPSLPDSPAAAASMGRPLPITAPKTVRFGAVIVRYRGAQLATDVTRSKKEAHDLANQLAEVARKDFKAAVKQGDDGSREDAGRISRGILEPNVEYELFTLAPGGVSDPIDTPRGFWIAKRIE
jgi:hypothetical protein